MATSAEPVDVVSSRASSIPLPSLWPVVQPKASWDPFAMRRKRIRAKRSFRWENMPDASFSDLWWMAAYSVVSALGLSLGSPAHFDSGSLPDGSGVVFVVAVSASSPVCCGCRAEVVRWNCESVWPSTIDVMNFSMSHRRRRHPKDKPEVRGSQEHCICKVIVHSVGLLCPVENRAAGTTMPGHA